MTRRLATAQKLALANSLLLVLAFGGLLLTVTLLAERYMLGHIRESVAAELHILSAEQTSDGSRGIAALIAERTRRPTPDHDRLYRLESATGERLAGNLDHWPVEAGAPEQPFLLPSRLPDSGTRVMAEWQRLGDGSRLLVGFDEIEMTRVRQDIRHAALWCLLAVLLVALPVGYLLTRSALQPIDALRRAAERILHGDLRHRLPLQGSGDGFDRLAETLNAMLDRINALITSVKGASDDIAHDLRSPLTRLRARLEASLREPPPPAELPAWIERHLADLDRVLATFQALLRIANVESGLLREAFEPCDLAALTRDAADYTEPLAETRGQRIALDLPAQAPLAGHRHLLFQMLVNLLDNAVKYGPDGGLIRLGITAGSADWLLTVADEGPGIPAAERTRIFERLHRLDSTRQTPGLGLGLALVRAVAELHGGAVQVHDAAPGATFEVRLSRSP